MTTIPDDLRSRSRSQGIAWLEQCAEKGTAPYPGTEDAQGSHYVRRPGIRRQRPGISSRLTSRKRPSMMPAILALILLILLIIWYLNK